jgi:hypothetical protein
MFLLQARQLLPRFAFFLFGHRHRWVASRRSQGTGISIGIIAFSTRPFKVDEKLSPINGFASLGRGSERGMASLLTRV